MFLNSSFLGPFYEYATTFRKISTCSMEVAFISDFLIAKRQNILVFKYSARLIAAERGGQEWLKEITKYGVCNKVCNMDFQMTDELEEKERKMFSPHFNEEVNQALGVATSSTSAAFPP